MEGNEVITLNLDKPRHMRLTNSVLKRFLSGHGLKMNDLEKAMQDYEIMNELVYEMLRAEDPELTPEYCDEILDNISIMEIIEAATQAITAAFESGNSENPQKVRKNSIGLNN